MTYSRPFAFVRAEVNAEMSQRPGNVQEVLSEAQDNDYNLLTDDSVR
eukprot:CAMPEP_0182797476 /NCGR_PEP_ID=MMETSP0006_2-20121128/829_1 /TAXON_ID=97485 /ORGANISM="Prymnesium parvum, Strain Texoma1" /LENGTH=46 /DNA_ID= /DNA_START= /DNA_END= /DNA_ORIENTATION=